MIQASDDERALLFALCHEVGNVVAAIRLEAHLLDGDDVLQLARGANSIEDLGARTGALIAQLRTMLDPVGLDPSATADPAQLLSQLADDLRGVGGSRIRLAFEPCDGLPRVVGAAQRIHGLLSLLALAAIEAAPDGAELRVGAQAGRTSSTLGLEFVCDAAFEAEFASWHSAALRGLPLALHIAEASLRPLGGGVECEVGPPSLVVLRLPVAGS